MSSAMTRAMIICGFIYVLVAVPIYTALRQRRPENDWANWGPLLAFIWPLWPIALWFAVAFNIGNVWGKED